MKFVDGKILSYDEQIKNKKGPFYERFIEKQNQLQIKISLEKAEKKNQKIEEKNKKRILENLPWGIGYLIIKLLTIRYLFTLRKVNDIITFYRKNELEKKESNWIIKEIEKKSQKKVILVYDNLSSGPTYGDFICMVMLARYFIAFDMPVFIYLVNGDNKHGWNLLDKKSINYYHQTNLKKVTN